MPTYTVTRTMGMVEVKGLVEGLQALGVFDQTTIRGLLEAPMRHALETVAVPAIRARAPVGPAPHKSAARGSRGRKGPLAKTITVRKAKRRDARNATEIAAMNVGPRAWYRHFVIQGTQAHTLRGPKGTYRMDGRNAKVPPRGLTPWHPGGPANNFVEEAVKPIAPALSYALGQVPLIAFKRALGKRIVI